jgi:hypothetical protein
MRRPLRRFPRGLAVGRQNRIRRVFGHRLCIVVATAGDVDLEAVERFVEAAAEAVRNERSSLGDLPNVIAVMVHDALMRQ